MLFMVSAWQCQSPRLKKGKSSATKSQRHERALILKHYQKEKKKVIDMAYTVHLELYYYNPWCLSVFVAELLQKRKKS